MDRERLRELVGAAEDGSRATEQPRRGLRVERIVPHDAASYVRRGKFLGPAALLEQRDELARLVRLGDVVIEARAARKGLVGVAGAAGDRDQRRLRTAVALAQLLRHLVAVESRHADVEEQ